MQNTCSKLQQVCSTDIPHSETTAFIFNVK